MENLFSFGVEGQAQFDKLVITCACGQAMRHMGVWPNQDQTFYTGYSCETCKVPDPDIKGGRPLIIKVAEPTLHAKAA